MPRPIIALALVASAAFAQDPAALPDYEPAPMLKAADILKPEYLASPYHRVLDNVTTAFGRNRYTIETPWGYFTAEGDAMLQARVAEARAIAELQNVSRTDEYKQSLKAAAKAPLNAVRGLVKDPVGAVEGTAKGVWKFMGRAGQAVKGVAEGRERAQGTDNAGESLLGLSRVKRKIAVQLGADPYSSNEIFQEKLEEVAWTSVAGEATLKLATLPLGGVGVALKATSTTENFYNSLRDLSPADLRKANKKRLIGMGVGEDMAERFLAVPAFSPSNQTAFVLALEALGGVRNRAAFVQLASETVADEADAIFCSRTAQLLAAIHAGKDRIASITTLGSFPVAIAEDGRLVVALQWDTAYWSERAAQFADRAQTASLGQSGPVVVAITGAATPRMQEELANRKIALLTHALPGPQK